MIHLDTSILIDALTGPRRSALALREAIARGERITFSSIVLYEWQRGPRAPEELRVQEALFPPESTAAFGLDEARIAAALYQRTRRARGREIDIAIAACAMAAGARLWTLNTADFEDLPGVDLYLPGV
ncbi:MAG TPA: PIN domain-containing protein [Methylomirabilota bacterium]